MSENGLPPGWDEDQVRQVIDHYENQTEEEAVAEDEEALDGATHAVIEVPFELLPAVRNLISKRRTV